MSSESSSNGLHCDICYQKYDLTTRLPRILPSCGHTFCSKCIETLMSNSFRGTFPCPFDKKDIPCRSRSLNDFPLNFQLRNMIEAMLSKSYCQQHHKPLDYICLTHGTRICGDCALLGSHKDLKTHNVRAVVDIEPLFVEKREYLESIKAEILSYNPDLDELKKILGEQKTDMEKRIVNNFFFMRNFFDEEENKQLQALDDFFKKQVKKTEKNIQEYQKLKDSIEEEISQYYRFETMENPIKYLNEEIWIYSLKLQDLKRAFHVETYWEFYGKLQKQLLETFESNKFQVLNMKCNTENIYKSLLEMKKPTQLQKDFETLSKFLSLNSSIPKSSSQYLEMLKGIKEVTFSSNNQQLLAPEEVSRFKRVRTSLPNIEKISACLNHSFNLDQEKQRMVNDLVRSLFWQPLNITTINLDLPTFAVSNKFVQDFSSKVLTRTLNLQELRLIFHRNHLRTPTLQTLMESIAGISVNLTSLELDFSNLSLEDQQSFPEVKFYMPKLKNFSVNLANRNVGDDWIRLFGKEALDSLSEVEAFVLNLRGTKVTEKEVFGLLKWILHGELNCKELTLEFSETYISESVIKAFKKEYKKKVREVKKIKIN